jgi:hypothetical protein
MKHLSIETASVALLPAGSIAMSGAAAAFDSNGAWATDGDNCAKVFARYASIAP